MTVLSAGLAVMTAFAESLPVAPVPEEGLVTTVRSDMVDHHRLGVARWRLLHAPHTQWVALKVALALPLPSTAVASPRCGAGDLRVERQVLGAVACAGRDQLRTARVLAWHVGAVRHYCSHGSSALPKCP